MGLDRTDLAASWRSWYAPDFQPVGPAWLQWIWTLLFCIAIALGFTVLNIAFNAAAGGRWNEPALWVASFGLNLVISLCIGVLIHLLFMGVVAAITPARWRRLTGRQRWAVCGLVPLVGLLLGWPLGVWLVGPDVGGWLRWRGLPGLVGSAAVALLVGGVIYLVFSAKARQALAEKRAAEAQLRLLQAQMEPHFLFNTLANVLTLIEADPRRASQMLEAFTDYLRATLANLRREDSTVDRELKLAEAYLQLLALRMEDRLQFDLEAGDDARRAVLPPLLLQPLVENAIHHGLEPKLEGGHVRVQARVDDGRLSVSVSDDGLGPDPEARPHRRSAGSGVALDNIRQRLQAQFGDRATLRLEALSPGTRATLTLPFALPLADTP